MDTSISLAANSVINQWNQLSPRIKTGIKVVIVFLLTIIGYYGQYGDAPIIWPESFLLWLFAFTVILSIIVHVASLYLPDLEEQERQEREQECDRQVSDLKRRIRQREGDLIATTIENEALQRRYDRLRRRMEEAESADH